MLFKTDVYLLHFQQKTKQPPNSLTKTHNVASPLQNSLKKKLYLILIFILDMKKCQKQV